MVGTMHVLSQTHTDTHAGPRDVCAVVCISTVYPQRPGSPEHSPVREQHCEDLWLWPGQRHIQRPWLRQERQCTASSRFTCLLFRSIYCVLFVKSPRCQVPCLLCDLIFIVILTCRFLRLACPWSGWPQRASLTKCTQARVTCGLLEFSSGKSFHWVKAQPGHMHLFLFINIILCGNQERTEYQYSLLQKRGVAIFFLMCLFISPPAKINLFFSKRNEFSPLLS